MAFPQTPLPLIVEILVDGEWVNISTDVRYAQGVDIDGGRANEQSRLAPGSCNLTINNRDGKYSPRNPNSPYFGKIGRNTPIRARVADGTQPSLRSSVTTAQDTGQSVTIDLPADVEAGDYLLLFHSVDASEEVYEPTGGGRWSILAQVPATNEVDDFWTTVWWRRATASEPASFDVEQWAVASSGVLTLAAVKGAAPGSLPTVAKAEVISTSATVSTPSITPQGDEDFELRWAAVFTGSGVAGATFTAPGGMTERSDLQEGDWTAGSLATLALASGTSTGAKTFTCSQSGWDDHHGITVAVTGGSVEFVGVVPAWPPKWDTSGTDVHVTLAAAGLTRRLGNNQALRSQLRRFIEDNAVLLQTVAYWPMEDGSSATSLASAVVGGQAMLINEHVSPGSASDLGGSGPLPSLSTGAACTGIVDSGAADEWTVSLVTKVQYASTASAVLLQWATPGGNPDIWRLQFQGDDTLHLQGVDDDGNVVNTIDISDSFIDGLLLRSSVDEWIVITACARQNGANISYSLDVDFADPARGGQSAAASDTGTVAAVARVDVPVLSAELTGTAIGHLYVSDVSQLGFTDVEEHMGHRTETAGARIVRLCDENGIALYLLGNPIDTEPVGPQGVASLLSSIEEAALADGGILYEARDHAALVYRTRTDLYNQDPALTLDYSAQHLWGAFDPVDDDQLVANDVTASRPGGSSARAVKETGRLSIQEPPDGVGVVDRDVPVKVYADSQLVQQAAWRMALGTWDEARYPAIGVNLARTVFASDAALSAAAASLRPGDVIRIENPPAWLPPDDIDVMVQGWHARLSGHTRTLQWNTSPAGPYSVFTLEDANRGRLDTDGTALAADITSSATSITVVTAAAGEPEMLTFGANARETLFPVYPLWTTDDAQDGFDIEIGGERITVTDVAAPSTPAFQVGTVAHAVNASVTPSLPASVVAGDLLVILDGFRATGTWGVAPAGWTEWSVFSPVSNVKMFAKIAGAGETNPTVTLSGSVANADHTAQIARWRGDYHDVDNLLIGSAALLNDSAQDIAYPYLSIPYDNALIIYAGWKQDDWTSVATISGATEIGEPDTTTGDDQGIVWDYVVQTSRANIAAGSFVVTGGASAISRGAVLAIRQDRQTFTATRSVNTIVKAHSAAAPVGLWRPPGLAL